MNENTIITNLNDYLIDERVIYTKIPDKLGDLIRIKEYINDPQERRKLILGCSNLKNGEKYFERFIISFLSDNFDELKIEYQDVITTVSEEYRKSYEIIGNGILEVDFVNRREARGFFEKERGDGLVFNANVFIKCFLSRVILVALKNGKLAIYNRKGVFELVDSFLLGKLIRHVMHEVLENVWKSNYETEVIKAIEREVPLVDTLDPYRKLINLENGMLHLETFDLETHSPNGLSSIQLPIKYDENAKCDIFIEFINEITMGDSELIKVIQEIVGYCLTSETKAEKAFYFYGTGSNGKSVLANIIKALVGSQNVTSITLEKLGQPFGLQSIIGKTVNIAAENELKGSSVNTENLKSLISGDAMTINIKYQAPIEYTPMCKLIFLVNSLPNTADATHGYFRKVMIVPFNRKFVEEERDVDLFDKLKANELPGILNWALEGLVRLRENNYKFSECKAIRNAVKEYEQDQNPVLKFIEHAIEYDENERLSRKEILEAYNKWLVHQSIDDRSSKSSQIFWKLFNISIDNKGIKVVQKKIKGYPYLGNIKFKSEFKNEIYNDLCIDL